MLNMKQFLFVILILFASAGSAIADDLERGLKAYESGDKATAYEVLLPLAEQGNAEAQSVVGLIFNSGEAVTQDYVQASRWLSAAAEQGMGEAQYWLGIAYYRGRGVPRDGVLAYMWFNLTTGAYTWSKPYADKDKQTVLKATAIMLDRLGKELTQSEIKEAQRRTREWLDAHPR